MKLKFGLYELKKETLKLLADYLGIPADDTRFSSFNDNHFIQTPDSYNSRGTTSGRTPASTKTP